MLKRALVHATIIGSILVFPWLCYLADPQRQDGTLIIGVILALVVALAYTLGAAQVQRQERRTSPPPRSPRIPRPRQPLEQLPRRHTR